MDCQGSWWGHWKKGGDHLAGWDGKGREHVCILTMNQGLHQVFCVYGEGAVFLGVPCIKQDDPIQLTGI